MKAILLLILMTNLYMYAMDFLEFKQKAVKNSNSLKSEKLSILLEQKRADFLQKIQNPTIELERSKFKDERGWRVGLSQPIRFLGVGSDLELLNSASIEQTKADFVLTKALFSKNLELLYTEYVYEQGLQTLIKEELELSKKVEDITKERLKNGVTTKVKLMMATLEKENIKNKLLLQQNSSLEKFSNLLVFTNLEDVKKLDAKFLYDFSMTDIETNSSNPLLLKMKKLKQKSQQKVSSLNHTIKSFELFGEYEDEPDSDIVRAGIAFSVPLFKQNSKEAELAKIEVKQLTLLQRSKEIEFRVKTKYLKNSISIDKERYFLLKKQLKKQQQLLELFEEGYKISKGSLLELIDVKNRLIDQKEKLLFTQKEANIKQIELNFLEGRYND